MPRTVPDSVAFPSSAPHGFLIDMDGVIYRGSQLIPGADRFVRDLISLNLPFFFLTNNSQRTRRDVVTKLHRLGIDVDESHIFTCAMATARFLAAQKPKGTAYVIGEGGLLHALHQNGYSIVDHDPDYVVLGETHSYNVELITKAIRLVASGARFIATNPDPSGPTEEGIVPACGAMAALIEVASGVSPFFVGKPNPLMMRMALNFLDVHSEDTVMIGDRMDTDILAGVESGMETILVLTGSTRREDVGRFPYQPTQILGSVVDIEL